MFTSNFLAKKDKSIEEVIDLEKPNLHPNYDNFKLEVNNLMLLGVLYCDASDEARASVFYEIV
jgi:hypothetical protein